MTRRSNPTGIARRELRIQMQQELTRAGISIARRNRDSTLRQRYIDFVSHRDGIPHSLVESHLRIRLDQLANPVVEEEAPLRFPCSGCQAPAYGRYILPNNHELIVCADCDRGVMMRWEFIADNGRAPNPNLIEDYELPFRNGSVPAMPFEFIEDDELTGRIIMHPPYHTRSIQITRNLLAPVLNQEVFQREMVKLIADMKDRPVSESDDLFAVHYHQDFTKMPSRVRSVFQVMRKRDNDLGLPVAINTFDTSPGTGLRLFKHYPEYFLLSKCFDLTHDQILLLGSLAS